MTFWIWIDILAILMGGSCGPILENGTEFKLSQVHDFDASAESEAFYPVQAVQDPSHSWVISDSE